MKMQEKKLKIYIISYIKTKNLLFSNRLIDTLQKS